MESLDLWSLEEIHICSAEHLQLPCKEKYSGLMGDYSSVVIREPLETLWLRGSALLDRGYEQREQARAGCQH